MSDKVSLYQAVKDNWAQLTVAAVVLGIVGGIYMEWRIESIVGKQLAGTNAAAALTSTSLKTNQTIVDMDKVIAANTSGVAHNKDNSESFERRLELAFEQLFGRPPAPREADD